MIGRAALTIALAVNVGLAAVQTPPPTQQPPPIPKPFPTSPPTTGQPTKPADPATRPGREAAPPETLQAGAVVYPGAEFLESFDAGRGQRYHLYGTNASFLDIVTYYKKALNTGGRELFRAPAMHQFDLGRFDDNTMAFPPSVVVKDYTWNGAAGYLFVDGTREKRFRTIIQIVPAAGR